MGKLAKFLVILQFLLVLGFVFFALKTTALIDSQRGTIVALKQGAEGQYTVMGEMEAVMESASTALAGAKMGRDQAASQLAQVQADLDNARSEIGDAESAKRKAQADLASARQEVFAAEAVAATAKAEVAKAIAEAGSSAVDVPRLEAERDQLQAMVVKLEGENNQLRQGGAVVTAGPPPAVGSSRQAEEIKRYKQQLAELGTDNARLDEQKKTLQGQLAGLEKSLKAQVDVSTEYKSAIARLEKKISDLQATEVAVAAGGDEAVVTLRKQISDHEKNALKLETEKNGLKKRVREQEEEIGALVEQLAGASRDGSSKGDRKKIASLEKKNGDLEDQLDEQEGMALDLKKKLAKLEDNIGDLEKALDKKGSTAGPRDAAKAQAMADALKETLNETVQAKKEAEKGLARSEGEAKQLQAQIASLENKLKKAQGSAARLAAFPNAPEKGMVAVANPNGVAALSFSGSSVPREGDLYYARRSDGTLVGKLRVENVDRTLMFVKFTPTKMNRHIKKGDTITLAKAD